MKTNWRVLLGLVLVFGGIPASAQIIRIELDGAISALGDGSNRFGEALEIGAPVAFTFWFDPSITPSVNIFENGTRYATYYGNTSYLGLQGSYDAVDTESGLILWSRGALNSVTFLGLGPTNVPGLFLSGLFDFHTSAQLPVEFESRFLEYLRNGDLTEFWGNVSFVSYPEEGGGGTLEASARVAVLDYRIHGLDPVPEPSTYGAAAIALFAALLVRRSLTSRK